jgi:predicted phosphodiesterase
MTICSLTFHQIIILKAIDNEPIAKISDFKPYKFIAFGDTRTDSGDNPGLEKVSDLINKIMQENQIEFILHSGDVVDNGGEQIEYDTYYWPQMRSISESVPIYYAVGNHEYDRYAPYSDPDLTAFRANVGYPSNLTYFSFNSPQNDTHFIILNSALYLGNVDLIKRADQQTWFEADLESNTIERIVLVFHHTLWGANPSRVGEYASLRPVWHDYFVGKNISLVINGHDHMFYHTVRNDIHYMVTGGGTSALYNPNPSSPLISQTWLDDDYAFADNHVALIEVTDSGFDVDVITTNNSVVYEYSIENPTVDIYPPDLTSPEDVEIPEGTNTTVSWTVTDSYYPGSFTILVNGTIKEEGKWNSGDIISYLVNGEDGGYNVTIVVTDANGNKKTDSVFLEVIPPSSTPNSSGGFGLIFFCIATVILSKRRRE